MNTPLTKAERVCAGLAMLAPLLGILAVGGCLNICYHAHGKAEPYAATRSVSRGIAEAFCEKAEWHYGSTGEAEVSHAYAMTLLPLSLVALPCEAVADTVTFPFDIIKGTEK